MRENKIEKYLVSELKKLGIETRKARWIGQDGCPDRFIFANGGVWVECKATEGALSDKQISEIAKMLNARCTVGVISSVAAVDHFVAALDRGRK